MPKIDFKPFDRYPQVKGVSVGRCVETGKPLAPDDMAHSHDGKNDSWKGWICTGKDSKLYGKDGGASNLMKHELAHIVTAHNHDKLFKKVLRKVGGSQSYMGSGNPK